MRLTEPVTNERAKAKDWGFANSKDKGTPSLWVDFVFLDITDDGKEISIRKDFWLTDNNFEYVLRDLENMGWAGKNIMELDKLDANAYDLSKHEVFITTKGEEYKSKMYQKVAFINSTPFAGKPEPIEQSEMKKISSKLNAKIGAYRKKNEKEQG